MTKKFFVLFLINVGVCACLFASTVLREVVKGWVFIVDKSGFIYSNYGENEIRKYSPEGKLLLKIGRKGQGPGDIMRLGSLAINPKDGNLYVTEYYGNKRVSIFSPKGKYIGELQIDLSQKDWNAMSTIRFDKDGNVYILSERYILKKYKDFTLLEYEKKIWKFSPYKKEKKLLYTLSPTPGSCDKYRKGNITIPFSNQSGFDFDLWEDKIAIKEPVNDFISIYDLNGKEIKKLYLPFKKEKVSNRDIEEWMEWHKASWGDRGIRNGWLDPDYLNYWKSRIPFPEYKPVSYGVFFDGKGNIFTKKFTGYKSKESIWIRLNISSGNYQIKKLENEDIIFVDKDWVYLSKGSDEEEVVIKMKREEFGL